MNSGMDLRTTIRAPSRYGEGGSEDPTAALLRSIRSARGQSNGEDEQTIERPTTKARHRKPPVRPKIVDYDPNLPPAPFPTLDQPRPKGSNEAGQISQTKCPKKAKVNHKPEGASTAVGVGRVPTAGQSLENHMASNNGDNPVYARNMEIMAKAGEHDANNDASFMTSDDDRDETSNASNRLPGIAGLVAQTPSEPAWSDLSPSLQAEIIVNLLDVQQDNWRNACDKLGLSVEEGEKVYGLMGRRNKQIERENKVMAQMRDRQLVHLMSIDNSTLRNEPVQPELVLGRMHSRAHRSLENRRLLKDLMYAKTSEVLVARQFLARRVLPRSLAGDWGHMMLQLKDSEGDPLELEKFEWKEDLTVSPEWMKDDAVSAQIKNLPTKPASEMNNLIQSIGQENVVSPTSLLIDKEGYDPIRDFEGHIPSWFRKAKSKPTNPSHGHGRYVWAMNKAKREREADAQLMESALKRAHAIIAEMKSVKNAHAGAGNNNDTECDDDDNVWTQFINEIDKDVNEEDDDGDVIMKSVGEDAM